MHKIILTFILVATSFADKFITNIISGNGLFFGETILFLHHLFAVIAVFLFAFSGTLLLYLVNKITPLRVAPIKKKWAWVFPNMEKKYITKPMLWAD